METEISLPQLLSELNDRDAKRRNAALETARKLSAEQLLELAQLESNFYKKGRRSALLIIGSISAIVVILLLLTYFVLHIRFPFIVFNLFTWMTPVMAALIPKNGRRNVAKLISDTEDVRLLGTTLTMLHKSDDNEVRRLCVVTLKRLLPLVRADQANLLSPGQREILLQQLKHPYSDTILTLDVLKALQQIGDERAIPIVEELTIQPQFVPSDIALQVQNAAIECLPYLRISAERQKMASTLLRGSGEPVNPDILLRPAHPAQNPETDPQQLLRADTSE